MIRKMIPGGKVALSLIDEVMNYVNPERKTEHAGEVYNFHMKRSEVIPGNSRVAGWCV